jgi:hypothetical protein
MSKRRMTACWIVLAAWFLCFAVLGDNQSQATAAPDQFQVESLPGITETTPTVPQAAQVRELTELRTAESKTFELADGQREWVGYQEPVHYQDSQGAFQDIDNRIIGESRQIDGVTYAYRNAANGYTARFGVQGSGPDLVSIEYQGCSIAFGPVGARSSVANKAVDVGSKMLLGMATSEDCIAYPQIYPGVDLV